MEYHILNTSNETIKRILNKEIETEPKLRKTLYLDEDKTCKVLYRIVETRKDVIAVIETLFLNID